MTRYCPTCDRPRAPADVRCAACGHAAGPEGFPADPLLGRLVGGRYRLERRLAAGGFGIVFAAMQLERERELGRAAVKLLRARHVDDPASVERFLDEARRARELGGPHAIKIYDAGLEDDGSPFVAMELLTGPSLREVLASEAGPLAPARAVRIAEQIARALAESHAAGIVHRDLKPANVHLERGDFVKVIDFGIARRFTAEAGRPTSVVGSPDYMAPEQQAGEPLDGRADVYALGVVLVELCSGERPVAGRLPEGVPAPLRALCAAMLEADPDDRPQSMEVVLRRLRAATQEAPAAATTTTSAGERPPLGTVAGSPSTGAAGRVAPRPRAVYRSVVAAAATLLVLVGGAVGLARSVSPPPPPARARETERPARARPSVPGSSPVAVAPAPAPSAGEGEPPAASPISQAEASDAGAGTTPRSRAPAHHPPRRPARRSSVHDDPAWAPPPL